jgi:UDP-N-acetylmuramyl pentapeptide synthase
VGAYARERGIEHFWAAGALCATPRGLCRARHFADAPALIAALGQAPPAAIVLVKGSRFMKMERVVAAPRATEPHMLLASPNGCRRCTRRSSASCASSST